MSALNLVKVKERPDCPSCDAEIALRETREKDQSRRRYYMQSKLLSLSEDGFLEPLANHWYTMEEIKSGEMHARCQKCKTFIEFEIKNGEIIGSKLRR